MSRLSCLCLWGLLTLWFVYYMKRICFTWLSWQPTETDATESSKVNAAAIAVPIVVMLILIIIIVALAVILVILYLRYKKRYIIGHTLHIYNTHIHIVHMHEWTHYCQCGHIAMPVESWYSDSCYSESCYFNTFESGFSDQYLRNINISFVWFKLMC